MLVAPAGYPGLSLRALLYCVFDKEQGPIVCCSDPPGAVGDHFKPLGRYLLPETFVKGRVVSVVLDDNVVLGAPVYIEDQWYDRNCFQFNICSVISSRIDVEPYRDLAQHLATAFHALEVEVKYLSRAANVDRVQGVLAELRRQLRTTRECFVRVNETHCISFRVWHCSPLLAAEPELIQVPVPLVDLQKLLAPPSGSDRVGQGSDPGQWVGSKLSVEPDLTLLHLAQYIDGARTVRDIIHASGLQQEHVLLCLRHLMHFGLVATIPAVSLASHYRLTPEFHTAFDRPDVAADVVRYVTGGSLAAEEADDPALVQVVQGLYAGLDGWERTLEQFQQANAADLRAHSISLRHFVIFGLLRGFIECADEYSQALSPTETSELQELKETIRHRKEELRKQGIEKVNQDQEIQRLVMRMNYLKAKEMRKPLSKCPSDREVGDSGSELKHQDSVDWFQ